MDLGGKVCPKFHKERLRLLPQQFESHVMVVLLTEGFYEISW
jgi:hypothetical protein